MTQLTVGPRRWLEFEEEWWDMSLKTRMVLLVLRSRTPVLPPMAHSPRARQCAPALRLSHTYTPSSIVAHVILRREDTEASKCRAGERRVNRVRQGAQRGKVCATWSTLSCLSLILTRHLAPTPRDLPLTIIPAESRPDCAPARSAHVRPMHMFTSLSLYNGLKLIKLQ